MGEAMRFTDRQELVDRIKTWQNNYERVCIERDDLEEHYQALLDVKEQQCRKMAEENSDILDQGQREKAKFAIELDELERQWKLKEIQWKSELADVQKQLLQTQEDRDKARAKAERTQLMADMPKEDP